MKKITFSIIVMLACMAIATPAAAQFNLKKAVSGAAKVTKAVTLTDEQMAKIDAALRSSLQLRDEDFLPTEMEAP